MKLHELKIALSHYPEKHLCFVLPDGDPIPAEFHVTEVGYVVKNFIDCGGTMRAAAACVLQIWVSENDKDHRLTAGKLATVLELAKKIVPSDDLDIEVEYEGCVVSQYPVVAVDTNRAELTFTLVHKHTDCLAKDICGVESSCCESSEGKCC